MSAAAGSEFGASALSLGVAIFAGAIRVGTPYLFVSLGECVTEKSGRVNLGLEGTLFMGAMTGYAISYETSAHAGSPWLVALAPWFGVLAAGIVGMLLGAMHALICNRPRVNSIAVGIAMMIFGRGLAQYLGKPYIQPSAPQLPSIDFGAWSTAPQIHSALKINVLFLIGVVLAPVMAWMLKNTRAGMVVRLAGESTAATHAMGYSINRTRLLATAFGGILAGIGGSYLSLCYPGSWSEQISSGQGLMAVALVIFARWNPVNCLWASLLFGGVGSLGLALQGLNLTSAAAAYLWNSAPYILTLAIMIAFSSRARALAGAPAELGMVA
jgi:simple sugar transport system permease protein